MERYMLNCYLKPIQSYHHKLRDEIARRFGLKRTKKENLDAHFTLKYSFETRDIEEIEELVKKFCENHKKQKLIVGGFGSFPREVIFMKVKASNPAKKMFLDLIKELKKVKLMTWEKYDGKNAHFHSTIAEECHQKYDAVMVYLNRKEKYFECYFDNITILKLISGTKYEGVWKVYNRIPIK